MTRARTSARGACSRGSPDTFSGYHSTKSHQGAAVKFELKIDKFIPSGYRGMSLKITSTDGEQTGDLSVGRATVEWMKG